MKECKIKCENWYWNRKLQLKLFELGAKWPILGTRLWNVRRRGKYLFLYANPSNGSWWLGWGTEGDYEYSPLPETTARTMLEEL